MEPTPTLQLKSGDGLLVLCPDLGAAIARFIWRGHEILRRAPDTAIRDRLVRQMGSYALVPFSNRIGQGKLMLGSQSIQLRANMAPEPHAIHGFGWQRPWKVARQTVDAVDLALAHAADEDWPFACEAAQTLRLTHNTLSQTLSIKNTGARPMPAGLGFHPFFPLSNDLHLQTTWKQMWKMGADMLPTELVDPPAEADFSELRPVAGWKVDHCFTGWSRRAVLDYATHRVQIDASDACRQIVCFAPDDGRNFIALEPVSNINNAFALAAAGRTDTGMKMLAPGEAFGISMSLALHSHA
jgi:aldose 1-epimerase